MFALLGIMLNVIAPIMLVMGIGYVIGKRFDPDPRTLSVYLIYLFTPALVFKGIYETELTGGDIGKIALIVVGVALCMALIGTIVARVFRYTPKQEGALILTVILVNAANYGIPLNTFAFGQTAGTIAIVYYVFSAMVGNVLGVYFASMGSGNLKEAVKNVVSVPISYAAIIAFALNLADIELPLILRRSIIDIAAQASIPMMLGLLGLQLSRVKWRVSPAEEAEEEATLARDLRPVTLATSLRLLVAPCIAFILVSLLGMTGDTAKVAIIQSSMPTAVLASALATQFRSDARFVSAVTLVATLASIATLSVLILLLGGVTA